MSEINPITVDRDLQLREKIEGISRECVKMHDELVTTLDKSNRVAQIVLSASRFIERRMPGEGTVSIEIDETIKVTPESEPNISNKISGVCNRLLKRGYLLHSKPKVAEDLVDTEFTFTVEFRDSNDQLIKFHTWELHR